MDRIRLSIGPNDVWIEGNLLFIRRVGPYLLEYVREFMSLADRVYRENGSLVMLMDVAQAIPPDPKARRLLATWPAPGVYPIVLFGVSRMQRVMLQLIMGARRLMSPHQIPPMHICSSEAEAYELVAKLRQGKSSSAP
ncbi:MAG TPA: hypothetical protein PLA87_22780 [Pseudomonadota bacterium]|nr:hypothetical protein [Pseudomonadota bacterium]